MDIYGDGIGDAPYAINDNNAAHYPTVLASSNPIPMATPGPEPVIGSVVGRVSAFNSTVGIGGLPVTLHIMGPAGEIYQMTTMTSSGIFTFDYIYVSGATYGYVSADMVRAAINPGETGILHGRTANFNLSAPATSAVAIVLQDESWPFVAYTSVLTSDNGDGVGGASVTIHFMDAGGHELFNQGTTPDSMGSLQMSLPNNPQVAYVYITATKNDMSGRSGNIFLTGANSSFTTYTGNVVLHTPGPSDPATRAAWSGTVLISTYNMGFGGTPVTLHLLGADKSEIGTVTTLSNPYSSFTFNNISLVSGAVYGYVDASVQWSQGLSIYGRSDTYNLTNGRTTTGSIVLRIPMPDAVELSADPNSILVGGEVTCVTAQLYLDGMPYYRSNIVVTFSSDNDAVGTLPSVRTNLTDNYGRATIPLTSSLSSGTVNVGATIYIAYGYQLSDTIPVYVNNWGTIGGTVFDQNNMPVANAVMSLKDQGDNWVMIPENPQMAVSRAEIAPVGSFAFYRVPAGQYTLSWSKDSQSGSLPVTVSYGTSTLIFNINKTALFPGYTDAPAGYTTLYGVVLDQNKNAIPGANVTLYNTAYDSSTDSWSTLSQIAQTQTNSRPDPGLYSFGNVPYGTYKVMADTTDGSGYVHSYYAIVTLNSGGCCSYVVIPDYVYMAPPSPSPSPSPTVTPTPSPTVPAGNTIVSMGFGHAISMDYQTDDGYDTASFEAVQNVYETLFYFDGNDTRTPVGVLATGYNVSSDGLTYTIYLRPGVKFHDGTDFNASAVKYSLDRLLLIDNGQAYSNFIGTVRGYTAYHNNFSANTQANVDAYKAAEGIRVINDTCVQITLESPHADFIKMLTFPATSIMGPAYDQAHGGYNATGHTGNAYLRDHEAGTGPFILYQPFYGPNVTLVKNTGYWRSPAWADAVIIQEVGDYNTRLSALKNGSADFITPSGYNLSDYNDPSVVVETGNSTLSVSAIHMNNNMAPFNNTLVRQAFAESFNATEYNRYMANGFGVILNGPIPPSMEGYNPAIPGDQYDPTHAKELLVAAGYSNSHPTAITYYYNSGNTGRQKIGQMLKQQLESYDIGITIDVQAISFGDYFTRLNSGQLSIYSMGWWADYPSTDNMIYAFAYSGGYYASLEGYHNASVDAAYSQLSSEMNPTARQQLYDTIVRGLNADHAYIWTTGGMEFQPHRTDIKGYTFNAMDSGIRYYGLSREEPGTLNAAYIGNTIPSTVSVGSSYNVTVTFENTGNTVWEEADLVRMLAWGDTASLGITGNCDNHGCGYAEYAIASGTTVLPGESYTWNFTMTPSVEGQHWLGFSMAKDSASPEFFGPEAYAYPYVGPGSLDALMVSCEMPDLAVLDQPYTANVTVHNNGTAAWTGSSKVRLAVWGNNNPGLGLNGDCTSESGYIEYSLPAGTTVMPGEDYTWHINMTPNTLGGYWVGLGMVKDSAEPTFFGEQTYAFPYVWLGSPDALIVSYEVPSLPVLYQPYTVNVTMHNNGSAVWTESSKIRLALWGNNNPGLGLNGDCTSESGYTEYSLPAGTTVMPGEDYTWHINATPNTEGGYWLGFGMVKDSAGPWFFGQQDYAFPYVWMGMPDSTVEVSSPDLPVVYQPYEVTVTAMNTGSAVWAESSKIRLAVWGNDPAGAGLPGDLIGDSGYREYVLPAGVMVRPGEEYTWHINATPTVQGGYWLGFGMVKDSASPWFFGEQPYAFPYVWLGMPDQVYVSDTIPTGMTEGQTYHASITFRNTGSAVWTEYSKMRLAVWGNNADLGLNGDCTSESGYAEYSLPAGAYVMPGQEYTWAFDMTPAAPGGYWLGFSPMQDKASPWFYGPVTYKSLAVDSAGFTTISPGVLSVATDASWAPFESINTTTGQPEGFDIDLMNEIGHDLGLNVAYTDRPFSTIITSVAANQYDCSISAFTITPERQTVIDFSDPYYESRGSALVVRPGCDNITRAEDLANMTVGVQAGTVAQDEVLNIAGVDPANVKSYDSMNNAMLALKNGEVGVVAGDYVVMKPYVDLYPADYQFSGTSLGQSEYLGIVISKDNPGLTAAINEALADIKADGRYDTIFEKWFYSG